MQRLDYKSREVKIGNILVGRDNPIVLQSMTSTKTMDTEATVAQSIRMIKAGCQMVRITAPGIKEAEHLAVIKAELKKQGYNIPLIADIHYSPKAAEVAASIVEKVRINPGNYIDRKRGKVSFSETVYQAEIEKIKERIQPLIEICKKHNTALRIGSNHGSLSERILFKYGDTPEGMVESAMEFIRICESLDFYQIVLSMKSSNVKVMVQANRLLLAKMIKEGMNYPIHLGVTEAGDAEDGRIKSASGIGPLLLDGIGDTIRVSLTEEPEFEIPVAQQILKASANKLNKAKLPENRSIDPFSYQRKESAQVGIIGNHQVPVVLISEKENLTKNDFPESIRPDIIIKAKQSDQVLPGLEPFKVDDDIDNYLNALNNESIILIESTDQTSVHSVKNIILKIMVKGIKNPIILKRKYKTSSKEELMINASVDFAYFLVDGLLDGIWIENETISPKYISESSFGILQATGARISKTEYIACPSCGRTQFKIQQTLQEIKSKTNHLKGLKIGVMGCCVNGPGEMADAHYGYVGAGKGKITLYKQKQIMKIGLPENEAVDELINMIKADGKWIDPK
jgi:(E)-4-hydroxy-3-methylbut-2-enyl-diphosphate synthase